jgi:hypothetical protein
MKAIGEISATKESGKKRKQAKGQHRLCPPGAVNEKGSGKDDKETSLK